MERAARLSEVIGLDADCSLLETAKGDIRRLARRGGVTRISGLIYDEVREVVKERLRVVSGSCFSDITLLACD